MKAPADTNRAKTYLTTEQFIKVFESLNNEKKREPGAAYKNARFEALDAAWDAAWEAAWHDVWDGAWSEAWLEAWSEEWSDAWWAAKNAGLALRAKDLISDEHFTTLAHAWVSCNLSLYAEDWADVLEGVKSE